MELNVIIGPVIALAAPCVVEVYPGRFERIKDTADFYFTLPVQLTDFEKVFRICMDHVARSRHPV